MAFNLFKRQTTLTQLREDVYGDAPKVDRDAGVIRDVKILGRVSKNGRTYSDKAMSDAARLYEGRKVNVDHPGEGQNERGFLEGIGELRNVRRDGDKIVGDLHYAKSHPSASLLAENAERFPGQFGLSHNAEGRVVRQGGQAIVESVDVVHSVDIVGQPATNAGLFESHRPTKGKPMKVTVRAIAESITNRVIKSRLTEMTDPMLDKPVEVPEMEGEGEAEATPEDQVSAAFRAMVMAVLDDTTLDVPGKIGKIKQILVTEDKLMNGGTATATTDPAAMTGDGAVAESIKAALKPLTEQIASMQDWQVRSDCRALLEAAGVDVTGERLEALIKAKPNERAKLVESWPQRAPAQPAYKPIVQTVQDVKLKEGQKIDFKSMIDR